ncbi:MAG TPA: hypothetical protein VMB23_05470 [Spirochaetia bacterium]|jgi:hypothetical protein|nr:hypothetical protein [Spirochaetia bacterium]
MLDSIAMADAVRMTFEEMAFLDVAPGPARPEVRVAGGDGPVLFLTFSRPVPGAMALFLPKAVKFSVAEAIYGEDWNLLSPVQLDDSLLELLNVLGGRLLSCRFGQGGSTTMGLPTVLYDPPGDLPGMTRQDVLFHVDEQEFTLVWYEEAP